MNSSPPFPNDSNGDVLRRMYAGGDDLTKPRMIDFYFIFIERLQALAFADIVDDKDKEICISFCEDKDMWQVIVHHHMAPDHTAITAMEAALTSKAGSVGGKADGWGCMQIDTRT
jgi:hypothetical protein